MVSTIGVAENDDSEACYDLLSSYELYLGLVKISQEGLQNVAYMIRTNRPAENRE